MSELPDRDWDQRTRPNVTPRSGPLRNKPCPCGSGKKFKRCCLLKPKAPPEPIRLPDRRSTAALAAILLAETMEISVEERRREDV